MKTSKRRRLVFGFIPGVLVVVAAWGLPAMQANAGTYYWDTNGSLAVNGQTYVGRAAMRTDPSTTSAAVYQSGGTATLTGLLTVGYAGTAASLYDINAGTLNGNGGLLVGDGATGRAGNGVVDIHGSGIVNVYGSGLVIGQDSDLTTNGSLNLAGGSLNIGSTTYSASLTLGKGGLATFSRTGGAMYVKSDLQVGGIGTLILDASGGGSVATSFGHTLTRISSGGAPALGLLVVVPYTGDLGNTEPVSFGTAPTPVTRSWETSSMAPPGMSSW